MFEIIAFYLFSFLTIGAFTITVTTKQPLYALTTLGAGMIFISAFFFLLDADFIGVVQIVVYTGAVLALYAFGMMFFDTASDVKEDKNPAGTIFVLGGLASLIVVLMVIAPIAGEHISGMYPPVAGEGNVENIGYILFTKYLVPFEVAAVMLLTAMIAGIVLASKHMDMKENG
jgi:NADH-quinone oxidoreductase subunit J